MSVNETFDSYYAATAYTPEKRHEWESENPKRDKLFGSQLSWDRKTQDTGPEEEYDYSHIEISQQEEKRRSGKSLEGKEIYKELKARYDYQVIMPPNYKALATFFFMTTGISKGLTYMSAFGYFAFSVLLPLYVVFGDPTLSDYKDAMIYLFFFLGPVFFICLFLWKSGELLNKKRPDIFMGVRKGPLWQANRQTGMLTFYKKRRAWKQRLQAPFHEFDAFLQSSPDSQGSSTYSLFLYHPQQRIKQKLDAQFPPTKMEGELVAAWQFLQRYMDVSQPLPDVPGLEIHRHKDPTTAASDKRRKRNPRYWRDMSEQNVNKIQREKYLKNIRR
ncbi:hypothetical protein SAMN05661010_03550 [Modicisalibacter muralis]|uniref:Uncharacterized protein n=1 Tax=Modicisalibacter muralis TaxID=119000 RepID=A0A1G9R3N2_9GAMM|nr:hypothetical protein [Halomonas muralis]SDM17035.1 hypothetical protein SAMN05661010_03550 [Halomonas muralis]